MSSRIFPIFPLQLVVLPQGFCNLHIFEPRYKKLMRECRLEGKTFLIPVVIENQMRSLCTEMKLLKVVREYPNGEMDIETVGLGRWQIQEVFRATKAGDYDTAMAFEKPYPDEGQEPDPQLHETIVDLAKQMFVSLKIEEVQLIPSSPVSALTYSSHLGMSTLEAYRMLSFDEERDRQMWVMALLMRIIPLAKLLEEIKNRAKLNGHYKTLELPDKDSFE